MTDLDRKDGESPDVYLCRAGFNNIQERNSGQFEDPSRLHESNFPDQLVREIKTAVSNARMASSGLADFEKNDEILKNLEMAIGTHDKGNLTNSSDFDGTERNRRFFERKWPSRCKETYLNTLFFPYNSGDIRGFIKEFLKNKTIVLLGGGRSRIGEEFSENDIAPRQIVNADPFVEDIQPRSDPIISVNAADPDFIAKMRGKGIDSADEIWAVYSVPAYLQTSEEISQMVKNMDCFFTNYPQKNE